jgi:RNA polymerase sigma-B factor
MLNSESPVAPAPPDDRPVSRLESAPAVQARETRRLLERYHRDGDAKARDELATRFMPLARHLARRYYHGREPLEDLVQVACLGLIKAIDRFEIERTTSFTSFALPSILGELRRYFRDSGWGVHVPRGLQERVLEVEKAIEWLTAEDRCPPTPAKIAEVLGRDIEDVLESLVVAKSGDVLSLDAPREGNDGELESRVERIAAIEDGYELIDYRSAVASGMRALPERERVVLGLRFLEDMTQTEIAARIGVSQMQVSRLVRQALARLQSVADQQQHRAALSA